MKDATAVMCLNYKDFMKTDLYPGHVRYFISILRYEVTEKYILVYDISLIIFRILLLC